MKKIILFAGTVLILALSLVECSNIANLDPLIHRYEISIKEGIEHGALVVDQTTAKMGEKVTVTVIPESGYKLSGKVFYTIISSDTIQDMTDAGIGKWEFEMPEGDVIVAAEFIPIPADESTANFKITGTAFTGGTIEINSSPAYENDTVTLTIKPDTGYELKSISACKTDDSDTAVLLSGSGDTRTFTMPAYDVTVSAEFEKILYSITDASGSNGSVTATPASAGIGDTITLTVNPDSGYRLKAGTLKVNLGNIYVTPVAELTYTFTMPGEDVNISADFETTVLPTYTITGTAFTGGTIEINSSPAYENDTVTLTIKPDTGYELKSISACKTDDSGTAVLLSGSGDTRTFTMPAYNVTVNAEFQRKTYNISYGTFTNGSVSGPSSAVWGDLVTLTVTPAANYTLTSLKYNGNTISGSENPYTFTMPQADVIISAEFTGVDQGTGSITITGPRDEDIVFSGAGVSANMTLSRSGAAQIAVTVSDSYTSIAWYVDSVKQTTNISGTNGCTFTIKALDPYVLNQPHELMVMVYKDAVPYSQSVQFKIVE